MRVGWQNIWRCAGAGLQRVASTRMFSISPWHHESHLDVDLFTLTLPTSTVHQGPFYYYICFNSLYQFTVVTVMHHVVMPLSWTLLLLHRAMLPVGQQINLLFNMAPCPWLCLRMCSFHYCFNMWPYDILSFGMLNKHVSHYFKYWIMFAPRLFHLKFLFYVLYATEVHVEVHGRPCLTPG